MNYNDFDDPVLDERCGPFSENLYVLGYHNRSKSSIKNYLVLCNICSQDKELNNLLS